MTFKGKRITVKKKNLKKIIPPFWGLVRNGKNKNVSEFNVEEKWDYFRFFGLFIKDYHRSYHVMIYVQKK